MSTMVLKEMQYLELASAYTPFKFLYHRILFVACFQLGVNLLLSKNLHSVDNNELQHSIRPCMQRILVDSMIDCSRH
jgi:hypothetical protein